MLDPVLRTAREQTIREHMDAENRHDFAAAMATFEHPRYELVATGHVHDGPSEVSAYYDETRRAFPDQRNQIHALHVADDAILVEFDLLGTHEGSFRGVPPTGRAFTCRMNAVFVFAPGRDRIICERVYFDAGTILRQLGLAHDPLSITGRVATALNHPWTIGRAFARQFLTRS